MLSLSFKKLAVALATLSGVWGQTCLRTYEVVSGDYCNKIAADQEVSTYQLHAANPNAINSDCSNLWVGQILCLARSGLDCSPVAVVESGDTCESIATAFGTTYAAILANNPNVNEFCSNIYPELVLCVAEPEPVPRR